MKMSHERTVIRILATEIERLQKEVADLQKIAHDYDVVIQQQKAKDTAWAHRYDGCGESL